MPITSPGNDDDTGENHQPTLRKNTAEPVEQTLKQNSVVGSFPDGRSALMRVCARYVTSNEWSTRRYLDMSRLGETVREAN